MTRDQVVLRSGRAVAVIALDGGRLASLTIDGFEVLVTEGDKPSRWGSFPMVPWAGRLPYGQLAFEGETHTFPRTSPPHANHGVGHTSRWRSAGLGTITTDLGGAWPYGGRALQHFDLTDSELTVEITVENDSNDMPAMAGWHPWFRRVLRDGSVAELDVDPGRRYELDDDMIPTGRLVDVGPPPWNETFVELSGDPVISWGAALRLEISSTFDHWVIFTEPEHALCVEPQSGPPNELNSAPFIVGPGRSLTGQMVLRWS